MKNNRLVLGKRSDYSKYYSPKLLCPISRQHKRNELNISSLPFSGMDFWNTYELSWLDLEGKPQVAVGQFVFPCRSPKLIESKSMKLYLFSFSQTKFENKKVVEQIIQQDLSQMAEANVSVKLYDLEMGAKIHRQMMSGICLDQLQVTCSDYKINTKYLTIEDKMVTETLYTNLFKSNCLITNQPDWASIQIIYSGFKINHEGLLKYLISYREHNEFHEQCVERIFVDIQKFCNVNELSVYAKFTRRGGIDINPFRSTKSFYPLPYYTFRQ